MSIDNKTNRATIDFYTGCLSLRKLKSKRNNSLPDLEQLTKNNELIRSKEKLKYNKWYIKPELRLKTNVDHPKFIRQELQSNLAIMKMIIFIIRLFTNPPQNCLTKYPSKKKIPPKEKVWPKVMSDTYNIKMLINFKKKQQRLKKRTPGMVDYFIKYKKIQEQDRIKAIIKKRKKVF